MAPENQSSPLSLVEIQRGFAHKTLVYLMMLLSYALKTQSLGLSLPVAVSLWHKGGFHARTGSIIGAIETQRNAETLGAMSCVFMSSTSSGELFA